MPPRATTKYCNQFADAEERYVCRFRAGHDGPHHPHINRESSVHRAPLTAHPATTPEPMTEERLAVIRSRFSGYRVEWAPEVIELLNEVDRLRASSPSRDSGALPDFTAMVRRVANSRTAFRESPAAAELLAAIAALAGSPSRVSDVDQANLARLDAIREEMFAVGAENDELRSRLSTLERDAARMREAATQWAQAEDAYVAHDALDLAAVEDRDSWCRIREELHEARVAARFDALREARTLTPSGEPTTTPETNE